MHPSRQGWVSFKLTSLLGTWITGGTAIDVEAINKQDFPALLLSPWPHLFAKYILFYFIFKSEFSVSDKCSHNYAILDFSFLLG